MSKRAPFLIYLFLTAASFAHDSSLEGRWAGGAKTADEQTSLQIDLSRRGVEWQARLTLPEVGVRGWPAESVEVEGARVTLIVRADSGPQTMILSLTCDALRGRWKEPGFEELASVHLDRVEATPTAAERRVTIDGPTGKLGASLILPSGRGPFPGIVFLHGSGPQPRDANRWAAHAFAEAGIVSLIFDKRGVGESEGSYDGATLEELATDGIAAANFLLHEPTVSAVGFAGHSQGGWVAPLAGSLWPSTAFVITSAGPAVPPSRETHWPVIRRMRRSGASVGEEEAARRLFDLWHEGLRERDWEEFDRAFAAAREAPWFESSGIAWLAEQRDTNELRSYLAIMDYDPIPALEELDAPMLALLSPDDESIDAVETEQILRSLANSGLDIRVRTYPGYDHRMRKLGARWPTLPGDYYEHQAHFVRQTVGTLGHGGFSKLP